MTQATTFSVPTTGPAGPDIMAARIDDNFKAAMTGHSGSGRPAYADAGIIWQDTSVAGSVKFYFYDGTADILLWTVDTAGDTPKFFGGSKWSVRGIGEYYFANTAVSGVDVPPQSDTETVWVELTAGLTGSGAFNNGKLTSESVSGSAPLVLATAVVAVSGSPMNGQTISLINTEGRILRPSTSPNTKQDDAIQGHFHSGSYVQDTGGGTRNLSAGPNYPNAPSTGGPISDGTNGTPRIANETRMKNIGVKAYMRVK